MGSEILTEGYPLGLPNKEHCSRLITGTLYRSSSPNYNFLRYVYTHIQWCLTKHAIGSAAMIIAVIASIYRLFILLFSLLFRIVS